MRAEPNHVVPGQVAQPFAVVADLGALAIENFVDLVKIGLRIGAHLFARQRRTRFGLTRGIAHHGREIPDEKNGGMALLLEVLELAQNNGVAQMQVRRRRDQRPASRAEACLRRASVRFSRAALPRE